MYAVGGHDGWSYLSTVERSSIILTPKSVNNYRISHCAVIKMTYNNVFNYILMLIDLLFSLHIQGGTLKLASGVLLLAWLHPEAQWEWLFSMESK